MISFLKTNKELGIRIWALELSVAKHNGMLHDEYKILIGVFSYALIITFMKEAKDAEKNKQTLKESKNNAASA
tara:strand:- start:5870 stop:6088 length:219 start_codon:yes stop_codon:yes gene_type:complete